MKMKIVINVYIINIQMIHCMLMILFIYLFIQKEG
jgi:hypothetical protein